MNQVNEYEIFMKLFLSFIFLPPQKWLEVKCKQLISFINMWETMLCTYISEKCNS